MSIHAQATPPIDSLDYYPYRAGDAWRLRHDRNEYPPETHVILRDSVDDAGNLFLFEGDGMRKIDTAGDVYALPNDPYPLLIYRLQAKVGDRWKETDNPGNFERAWLTCTDIRPATVLGRPTVVKVFQRWRNLTEDGGPDSVWVATLRLARGFGIADELYEPDAYFYLSGARIAGQSYGEPIAGVLDRASAASSVHITPNPFTVGATIAYHLDTREHVRLTISDALGRPVAIPVDEVQEAGERMASIDGSALPDGAYFYQLHTSTRTVSGTLIRRH